MLGYTISYSSPHIAQANQLFGGKEVRSTRLCPTIEKAYNNSSSVARSLAKEMSHETL